MPPIRKRSTPCLVEAVEARLLFRTIFIDPNAPGPVGDGTSWDNAYVSLDVARTSYIQANDEVRIADGVFKPTTTTNRAVSFSFPSGCVIKGGYAGFGAPNPDARDVLLYPTVFSGDIGVPGDYSDNSYHVFYRDGSVPTPVTIDGLTITGGNNTAVSNPPDGQTFGGGIAGPSLNVVNCIITGNRATDGGGGAVTSISTSFTNCTFSNNFAPNGAGLLTNTGSASISGCTFINNVATGSGGGLYSTVAITIANSTFTGNSAVSGGALAMASNTPLTLTTSTFMRNSATAGGAIYLSNAAATINRCKFNGNSATTNGGAIYDSAISLNLFNSAFTGNNADLGGGVFNDNNNATLIVNGDFLSDTARNGCEYFTAVPPSGGSTVSNTSILNSIFWSLSNPAKTFGDGYAQGPLLVPSITYSDFQGGFNDVGNVNVDPQFMRNPSPGADGQWATGDDDYGDLRLFAYSPLADAGNNNAVTSNSAGTVDLVGPSRFRDIPTTPNTGVGGGPIVDIGACEAVAARAATAGGPYVGVQGHQLTLRALAASTTVGSLLFEWDFDNDGIFDDAIGTSAVISIGTPPPGTILPIAVRVTDGASVSYVANTTILMAPAIVRVDSRATGNNDGSSWTNAYNNLAFALNNILPFQEIRVATGTYKPTTGTDRYASFSIKNGNLLLGGYAGLGAADPDYCDPSQYPTILSGEIGSPGIKTDNSVNILNASNTDSSTRIDGFTITSSYGNLHQPSLTVGGGLIVNGGSPAIQNCIFISNFAFSGGAVYCVGALPSFSNCQFRLNDCFDFGGAVYAVDSTLKITDCTFQFNRGEATIYETRSASTLANCTFAGRSSGAVINVFDSSASKLANCIFWSAFTDPSYQVIGTGLDVTYSDVQGGYAGIGNINADPQFLRNPSPGADNQWGTADDDFGDLRLQPTSPCIDTGSNAAVPAEIKTDLAGNPRIVDVPGVHDFGEIVDMGAYEKTVPVEYLFNASKPSLRFVFDVALNPSTLDVTDLSLLNAATGQSISFSAFTTVSYDASSKSATWRFEQPLPDGDYRAVVAVGSVKDANGANLPADVMGNFFILAADANRDRKVDIKDLSALAANWQGNGKTFSQGDFNYDGKVDAKDLGILSDKWSTSLLPPPAAQPATLDKAPARRTATRVASLIL